MSVDEYLRSTPPEINLRIEAWNDARRRDAHRDYSLAVLIAIGVNNPKKFPDFERFYPEKDRQSRHVTRAMETAKKLGDI